MKRILIIDDNQGFCEVLAKTLKHYGWDTAIAINGTIGLQMARSLVPDLILCDVTMPDKDGFSLFFELQEDKATRRTPFVFLTANGTREMQRRGMGLGADDSVEEPFAVEELVEVIKTRLRWYESIAKYSEQKLDNLRQRIIHSLSHEFRIPLTIIKGYISLVDDQASDITPFCYQMTQEINEAGRRLERSTNKFLHYTETELYEDFMQGVDHMECYPAQLIQNTAEQGSSWYKRQTDLVLSLMESAIQIPEYRLTAVIVELLDNAFKFSGSGTPVCVKATVHQDSYQVTNQERSMTPE